MSDRYDDMSKRLDESLRVLKQMKEELEKDISEMKKEERKGEILSDRYVLKDKISLINERLKVSKDISTMDYVMTLELIRKIISYYKNNSKNSKNSKIPYSYYDLVLSEIEPALDDLTIESLMAVISQYQDIDILRYKHLKLREHNNLKNNINKRHNEFQKVIKRGWSYE